MPQPLKVVISAFLIAFFLSLSASIEAEAAGIGEYDPLLLPRNEVSLLTNRGTNSNIAVNPGDVDVYAFVARNQQNTSYGIYLASPALSPNVQAGIAYPSSGLTLRTLGLLDDDTLLHYTDSAIYSTNSLLNFGTPLLDIPQYATIREGLDAISASLNPVVPLTSLSYDLLPGYALYLDVSGIDTVSVSSIITANSGVWRSPYRSNQYVRFVDELPARGSTLQPSGDQIVYLGLGDTNLIGLYRRAGYGQTYTPSHRYLVVYNPLGDVAHGGETGNSGVPANPTMHINVSAVRLSTSRLYSLSTSIMSDGLIGDVAGDYGLVDNDGTIAAVDDNGDIYTPVVGGATLVDAPRDINDFLQSIADDVSGFFAGAISAVTTLVNSGSAFVGLLGQLYTWLPSEVFATLKAALVLVITIGVIKVFV